MAEPAGPAAVEEEEEVPRLEIDVPREGELRIHDLRQDTSGGPITLKLIGGDPRTMGERVFRVEVNGSPLQGNEKYVLPIGGSVGVYGWSSARMLLEGPKEVLAAAYRPTTSTFFKPLAELHTYLHAARRRAEKAPADKPAEKCGPRVVICGGKGAGKHTAMRTLANYAARLGWAPIAVDCCPGSQKIGPPGSVAATVMEFPLVVDEEYSSLVSTFLFCGTVDVQSERAADGKLQTYHDGTSVKPQFTAAVDALLNTVSQRMAQHSMDLGGWSGCIVTLPALRGADGVAFVREVIEKMDATHVVCIGDDFLHGQLNELYYVSSAVEDSGASTLRVAATGHPLQLFRMSSGTGPMPLHDRGQRSQHNLQCDATFRGRGAVRLNPVVYTKPHSSIAVYSIAAVDGKCVSVKVERTKLDSIKDNIGSMVNPAAMPLSEAGGMASCPAVGFVHIQKVDAQDITFMANIPENGFPKPLTFVFGNVIWLGRA